MIKIEIIRQEWHYHKGKLKKKQWCQEIMYIVIEL